MSTTEADDLGNGSLCGHWCGLLVKSSTKIVRPPQIPHPNFAQCECISASEFLRDSSGVKRTVLTVGTFSGVHTGHRAVLNQQKVAARHDASTALHSFLHPRTVLDPNHHGLELLNTVDEKAPSCSSLRVWIM